jgi:hypothetical protein
MIRSANAMRTPSDWSPVWNDSDTTSPSPCRLPDVIFTGAEGEESPLEGEEEARRKEGQELSSSPSLLPSFVKMLR